MRRRARTEERRFWTALARAFGGAVIFSLPLLMTAEMWEIGATVAPERLLALLAGAFPLLVGLSYIAGFEDTFDLRDDTLDAAVALGIGLAASAALLWLFGAFHAGIRPAEVTGMIALQAVPGAIGALLSRSLLHASSRDDRIARRRQEASYRAELFTMVIGALFLALNIAPTEEIQRIALRLDEWHLLLLMAISLVAMHGFVYGLEFRGGARTHDASPLLRLALRFTAPGYLIALVVSLLVLWVFGRTEGLAFEPLLAIVLVLGLPAALGAAAARLVL
jgi:putative integral membrane protein (TIGR02587 family)